MSELINAAAMTAIGGQNGLPQLLADVDIPGLPLRAS